jgi:asparagine synthase (glutamine-hydrolysing)
MPRTELTAETLRVARGDFTLFAATRKGLLVGSGPGSGQRPIYVARLTRGMIACTHLEPLLAKLDEKPKLETEFLAQSLFLGPAVSTTLTPYVGIQKVPQGEAWLLGEHGIRRERLDRPLRDQELRGTDQELAVMLRESLTKAIQRASGTGEKVAISASGGLDSSALLALAQFLGKEGRLDAKLDVYNWVVASPIPTNDDTPYFRALADYLGIVATPITVADALEDFGRHMVVDGGPCFFPSLSFWTALSRVGRQRGVEMVISGIGGDQVMEGDPRLLSDLALRGHPLRAVRSALHLRGFGAGDFKTRLQFVARPAAARLLSERTRRARVRAGMRKAYPWAGPKLCAYMDVCSETQQRQPSLDSSPSERYEALLRLPGLDDWRVLRSQAEEAGGNSWKEPFLDDDFLRFVATLPPLSLLCGNYLRGLLREATRDLIPDFVRLRETKASFTPPLVELISRSGGFGPLADLARVRRLADLGLVEPAAFAVRFERARRDPLRDGWAHIWKVLTTEAFLRQHAGEPPVSFHEARAA